jgi:hypothetical protein
MLGKSSAWVIGWVGVAACGGQERDASLPPPPEVVIRMVAASAAECQFGGTVVSSGLDANGNGALDDREVETRTVLCSDPPVDPPPSLVVRLASEPDGEHCALGGTAVQSGLDRNRNGRLDDDEVEHVEYACGETLLSRIAAEPAGARCIAGGVAFLFGRDRDRDGQLGDGEVEQTEIECGSELARAVVVRTVADATALAGITIIDGSLTVTGTELTELSLPRLVQIRGALDIADNDSLVRVALPALQSVDDELTLAHNGQLAALELPGLNRVASLIIDRNAGLPDLTGLPALTTVAREVRISSNEGLVSADLSITRIGDALTIVGNPQLTRSAWSLGQRLPHVRIASNDRLDSVDVVVGMVAFSELPDVSIASNAQLHHVALTAFRIGAIAIEDNPSLTEVVATPDRFITGDVVVRNNGPLSLTINGSSFFALPTEITGSLTLSGAVQALHSAQPLVVDGDCTIEGSLLPELGGATSLVTVGGSLRLIDNAQLATMSTLGLGGGIEVRGNAALATLGFLEQDEIEGDVTLVDNAALREATSFVRLTRIHGDAHVASNPALQGLDFTALSAVRSMEVRGNATLGHLQLPQLRQADLGVFDNPRLPACAVAALFATLLGEHAQSGNDEVAECNQ